MCIHFSRACSATQGKTIKPGNTGKQGDRERHEEIRRERVATQFPKASRKVRYTLDYTLSSICISKLESAAPVKFTRTKDWGGGVRVKLSWTEEI